MEDVDELDALLRKENFAISQLGSDYGIRFVVSKNRIGSIAIDKDGRVFMRTERPRTFSKGKKHAITAFRTPNSKPRYTITNVKKPKLGETTMNVEEAISFLLSEESDLFELEEGNLGELLKGWAKKGMERGLAFRKLKAKPFNIPLDLIDDALSKFFDPNVHVNDFQI